MQVLQTSSSNALAGIEEVAEGLARMDIDVVKAEKHNLYQRMHELRRQIDESKAIPIQQRKAGRYLAIQEALKEGRALKAQYLALPTFNQVGALVKQDAELTEVMILRLIIDVYSFLNVRESLRADQFRPTAKMIMQTCKGLMIEDITVCFHRGKQSAYGGSYGRLDGQIFLEWLDKYKKERQKRLAEMQQNLYLSNQQTIGNRVSSRSITRIKKYL